MIIYSIIIQAQAKFYIFCLVKLIEFDFSAASVCSNPCVGPLSKIEKSFSLLSISEDELTSTPEFITFLQTSSPIERKPYPEKKKTKRIQNIFTDQYQYVLLI